MPEPAEKPSLQVPLYVCKVRDDSWSPLGWVSSLAEATIRIRVCVGPGFDDRFTTFPSIPFIEW